MTYTHVQKRTDEETQKLRKEGGRLVKFLRERAGISQKSLAPMFNNWHFTFVSQIENGRNRIPPDQMAKLAGILGVDVRSFVLMMMRYYDPVTFRLIFQNDMGILTGQVFPEFIEFQKKDAS